MRILQVISKIPSYYLFRLLGWPHKLPLSLTISSTYRCNSRCRTCNIYNKNSDELSLEEWGNIFKNYGRDLFWVTISGGEPFLREDIGEFVSSLYDNCMPVIINIPTNGILQNRIPEVVEYIANYCKKSQIVINVSIDDIGEKHDNIRGVSGSYEKALATFLALKSIGIPNLSVGIHTVISRFNVSRIPYIYEHIQTLDPDSYITEIAEEREELSTNGMDISPAYRDYSDAVDFLIKRMAKDQFNQVGKITRAFRIEYYKMVKRILTERLQIIPCYSGFASAQIAPNGDVWFCCIKAESIGNLRDVDYMYKKIWFSEKAERLRKSIKRGECYCPLANASYTNMLYSFKSLFWIGWKLIRIK